MSAGLAFIASAASTWYKYGETMKKLLLLALVIVTPAMAGDFDIKIDPDQLRDRLHIYDLFRSLTSRIEATNAALLQTNYGPITFKDSWGSLVTNAYVTKITMTNLTYRLGSSGGGTLSSAVLPKEVREHFEIWDVTEVMTKLALQYGLVRPTRTPAVALAQAEDEFKTSGTFKITARNSVYWRVSFIVNIWNRTSVPRRAHFKVKFLDAKGFTLDHRSSGELSFRPAERKQWSDFNLLESALASKVVSIKAEVD